MGAIVRWHLRLGDKVYVHDDFAEPAELLRKYPGALAWNANHLGSINTAVFSDAVPQNYPLRQEAAAKKIPVRGFAEELGFLCIGRRVIAIVGTHGKSTTTALLSWIFEAAGKDPLCFIGAEISKWGGGFRYGAGAVIVEADEYKKHFLNLNPETVVVASLEMDHFDTYANERELLGTFAEFCTRPSVRSVFVARGQSLLDELFKEVSGKKISAVRFGREGDVAYCENLLIENGTAHATIPLAGKNHEFAFQATVSLHISNLLGAIAVGIKEGIPIDAIQKAVVSFPGILRRMEKLGTIGGVPVYSDYAHHATAVRETLDACRNIWPGAKIAAIFEPHERLRTSRLRVEYQNAFSSADKIALLPVYDPKGRERADISPEMCDLSIFGDAQCLSDYAAAIAWAETFARENPGGVIIVMGAGPVDGAFRNILKK